MMIWFLLSFFHLERDFQKDKNKNEGYKKIGEKIRISGGGRCNFTNLNTHPSKFISKNSKFIISALNQYDQFDFIKLVESHSIKFHEKKLGQLFCDGSAQQIID